MPDARVKVLVLWAPIQEADNRFAAQKATAYLNDLRVDHFWDLWNFGMNHYTKKLNYPEGKTAWDIFVLYKPQIEWILPGPDPDPDYWMQHHYADIEPLYDKTRLKAQIEKLLE